MAVLHGKCMCGAVTYTVEDAFTYALNCHCSLCRQSTGAAFKPFAGITIDKFAITSGALTHYGDALTFDAFCAACGSLIYSQVRDGKYAHVTMGTLVDAPGIRPSAHIFVGSKAPWFEITDDLPQHQEGG